MAEVTYRIGSLLSRYFYFAFTDLHVTGVEHLPEEGPCLLFGNHVSHFDPPAFCTMFERQVFYMADKPLLEIPLLGRFLAASDVFPVDRTKVDRAAIRTALGHLRAGRVVGIFPEGGLRHGERSVLFGGSVLPGTISLWQTANVPAVPGVIIGTDALYQWRSLFRRPRVIVKYGPPLPAPRKDEERQEVADRLVAALRRLYREVEEEYQLRPEELPTSAQERWARR
jgi:1-acyl-sn-glycerol-3-phosphate acyltransferase